MPDMRPEKQALIDYLMNKTGGALVMTPDELALEIRVSAKQQSKLRKEFKFPIPYQNTGRKVYYSLYAVADYLLDGVTRDVEPAAVPDSAKQPSAAAGKAGKPRSRPEDMSQLFMLRNFLAALEEQKKTIDPLIDYFSRYVDAATMAEKLDAALAVKKEKVVMRAPWQD
ncbi:hypothetical protein [Variovorax sp. RCC_210]|uniref:hypothetical protein n=1 Tax=Variovorax sp. RCC_210 TaxID=3239217 RepID=UPI00352423FD